MHKHLTGLVILIFDILSLGTAFILSGIISFYISHNWFGNPLVSIFDLGAIKRLAHLIVMSAVTLFIFYNRGHYLRRIPWWSQIRYIAVSLSMPKYPP